MLTREKAIKLLTKVPYKFGHMLGFTKLTPMHNDWIINMVRHGADETLQAHRGSYKTTCVSIALAEIMILFPQERILFMRKTDDDVKEIIDQVNNILVEPHTVALCEAIWGKHLALDVSNATTLSTNLVDDVKGTPQLTGKGIGGSLTGKHFDRIFTDDIVNISDRYSRAERERTKRIYSELGNLINRGECRIFNTGTPWHKEDAFLLMPEPRKFDCYSTGLISKRELALIKSRMDASTFAANYELQHIAADDVIFPNPHVGADIQSVFDGLAHIDASYGGSDKTAFTVCKKKNGVYYVYGKLWNKHVDLCIDDIKKIYDTVRAERVMCEDNGDKGYLAKELRNNGMRTLVYHENTNKFYKITSYLKGEWENVVFVNGTDDEYISQIENFSENAEHDDAPDSLACCIRKLWKKGDVVNDFMRNIL